MFAILSLGFLLGMQHALEADHIAAVSSIAARRSDVGDIVKHGLTWGLGHTLTLFAFAGAAILLGHAIPEKLAGPLETAVGIMLVGLGAHLLWRLWRDRVHFHSHRHDDGTVHSTPTAMPAKACRTPAQPHSHAHGFRWRTLLVGLMHGMAGSAALLVLTVSQAPSAVAGLGYIALFGVRLDDRHGPALDRDRRSDRDLRALPDARQSCAAGRGRPGHDRDRHSTPSSRPRSLRRTRAFTPVNILPRIKTGKRLAR